MLAAALLAAGAVAPGHASARYCGSAYGDSYSFEDVNRQFVTSERYAVYRFGATKCPFARRWASRLSYNKHRRGPLALAWPDNPRTLGLPLVGPLPRGYRCRRAPSQFNVTRITEGPVFCRKVPEPRRRSRFYFYPDLRPSSDRRLADTPPIPGSHRILERARLLRVRGPAQRPVVSNSILRPPELLPRGTARLTSSRAA